MSDLEQSAAKKGNSLLPIFVLFLLLIVTAAGAGGGFLLWQELGKLRGFDASLVNQFEQQLASMQSFRAQVSADVSTIKESQTDLSSAITGVNSGLSQLEVENLKLAQQLGAMKDSKQVDWMLDEMEYFTKLAQHRLELTQDARGSISLLEYSDRIAEGIKEQGIIEVRSAFAADLLKLKQAQNTDIEGVYLKMQALTEQIRDMAVPTREYKRDMTPINEKRAELDARLNRSGGVSWTEKFVIAWEKFKLAFSGAFRLQTLDEPIEPLLSPDQRVFLTQNLTLLIEQAQLGLLRRENQVYQNSLDKVLKWVDRYYRQGTSENATAKEIIQELKAINVDPPVPNIAASIDAVVAFKDIWLENKANRAAFKTRMQGAESAATTTTTTVTDSVVEEG